MINRAYTRLWLGQAVSLVGDFAFDTAVLIWIATVLLPGRSYAPMVSSAMLITVALVGVVVGPVAGGYVDRWDARRTMLGADLVRCAAISALTALTWLPRSVLPVWPVLGLLAAVLGGTTIAAQFFSPARFVLLSDVVPTEQQSKAAGLAQATSAAAIIIGPPLGALLLVGLGPGWALAVNAASFLLSYLLIRSVEVPDPAPELPSADEPSAPRPTDGLRLVLSDPTLRAMLVAAALSMLGTGAINALDVYFVAENLHVSSTWFGVLEAMFGGGTMVGAWIGFRLGRRFGLRNTFCAAMLGYGALVLAYSRIGQVGPAVLITVLFGVSLGSLNTVAFPLILSIVPRSHLGRVMAVFNPANQLASLVSIALASVLISTVLRRLDANLGPVHFGRVDTVFSVSGLLILAGGMYATRALRSPQAVPNETAEATVAA